MTVSLAESLAGEDPPEDEETRARYRIGSLGEADWAARKLARCQAKIAERVAEADRQRAQIDEWLIAETLRFQPDVDYFRGLLAQWWQSEMGQQLDEVGGWEKVDVKSQRLPGGATVEASKTPDAMTVTDDAAFQGWLLRARPTLIEWKPKAKIADAKKVLTAGAREVDEIDPWATRAAVQDPDTGEVVPGVVFTSRIDFKVTLP